ncbi:MAG: methylated-DNA--[protein]-cysteine S-methyltransferase [Pseudolysinimonas sp.]
MQTPTDTPVALRRMASPIGRLEIVSNGEAITSLSIERDGALPHDELPEQGDPILDRALAQLDEYFAGHRRDFDLPLSLAGSAFQLAVWEQLVDLEFGEVVSYGEVGMATGRPAAGRAVGGAVGANPIPIIVPCHRVLGSDGRITGYSGGEGIPTKSWLLAHEGIPHSVPASARGGQLELDLGATDAA